MPFIKGKSGNPGGRPSEKPFAEALKMEIAAAGNDQKALREIARNLIELAQAKTFEAMPAINAIADRLDGKPAQESTLNIRKHDATDWTIADLDSIIAADEGASSSRTEAPTAGGTEPDKLH